MSEEEPFVESITDALRSFDLLNYINTPNTDDNMRVRKNKKEPKLLVQVLQALADIKDVRGSTLRRISDQVRTAINLSKIRPKPKNVVGQVRRALKHGVQTGVLKHRSGKFRLATATEINQAIKKGCMPKKRRKRRCSPKKRRRTRRRYVRSVSKRRRRPCQYIEEQNQDSYANSINPQQDIQNINNVPNDASYVMAARPRTRRTRKHKSRKRRTSKKRKRRRRRNLENNDAVAMDRPSIQNRLNGGRIHNDQGYSSLLSGNYPNMPPKEYPECDNRDCLCNLNQDLSNSQNDMDLFEHNNNRKNNNNYQH